MGTETVFRRFFLEIKFSEVFKRNKKKKNLERMEKMWKGGVSMGGDGSSFLFFLLFFFFL